MKDEERNDRSIEDEGEGSKVKFSNVFAKLQIFEREEMAVTEKASNRAGEEEGLERLLGLPEGDHAPLLSLRIPRK